MKGLTKTEMERMATLFGKANKEDLKELREMWKSRNDVLASMAIVSFARGQRVKFFARGRNITGVVTKINRKTVAVKGDDGVQWRVSPSLLKGN